MLESRKACAFLFCFCLLMQVLTYVVDQIYRENDQNVILRNHFVWKIASTTSRSKIIHAPARGIFRMLEIYREHISFTVYYCASGTDGNQMLNVVQRGKGKCPLLDLNLYIHTSRKKDLSGFT